MTNSDVRAEANRIADQLDEQECCQSMGGPGCHPPRCGECPRDAADMLRKLASPPPPAMDREAVARIIDPGLFHADAVERHRAASPRIVELAQAPVLEKADKIIALAGTGGGVPEGCDDRCGFSSDIRRFEHSVQCEAKRALTGGLAAVRWKLVPIEPTAAMLDTWSSIADVRADAAEIWSAMLEASPTPTSPDESRSAEG